jgi:hypothetical protein
METLLLVSTAIDCAAVAALGWIVWRAGVEREASLGVQRATLETLRADLAELVADAEGRARELDTALGSREDRLRALLVEVAEVEAAHPEHERGATEAAERGAVDPAEARLLRDLEMSFGRRRA